MQIVCVGQGKLFRPLRALHVRFFLHLVFHQLLALDVLNDRACVADGRIMVCVLYVLQNLQKGGFRARYVIVSIVG